MRERDLHRLFASVKNEKEARKLLNDLFTPRERHSLGERWAIVRALTSGMPQREISKKFNVSISKITRGSRSLRYGSGGFRLFLKRFRK